MQVLPFVLVLIFFSPSIIDNVLKALTSMEIKAFLDTEFHFVTL